MAHTFEELKEKTVAELRELVSGMEHDALKGYTTMHKADLLKAVCKALGVDAAVHHDVVGVDKQAIKAQIRELKQKRDQALEAHDHAQLRIIRRKMHRLKRGIRAATV